MEAGLGEVMALITASGALGTAASGMVETVKGSTRVGRSGLGQLSRVLGPGWELLGTVYGGGREALVEGAFRQGEAATATFLRTGLRLALTDGNAAAFGGWAGLGAEQVTALARALAATGEVPADGEARVALGRIELRIDAAVDAAVATSFAAYRAHMRLYAGLLSIAIGLIAGIGLEWETQPTLDGSTALLGFLVGVLAVPVAPIAKDLTSAIASVRDVLARRAA